MNDQMVPQIVPNVTVRFIGDEAFVMHLETKNTYSLNETAARIWSLIDGAVTLGDIADVLAGDYEIDRDECFTSVTAIIDELQKEQLLILQ